MLISTSVPSGIVIKAKSMEINSIVTKEDCMKVVHKFSVGKFKVVNYRITPYDTETLGFLGEHFRLQITAKKDDKNTTLQFFLKTVPTDTDAHKNYVTGIGVFSKEATLYKEILPKFYAISGAHFAPACYFVNIHSHFVLEDLSLKGFTVVKSKSDTFDLPHAKCLIETLAKFHAASIIFEEMHAEKNAGEDKPFRIYDHYKHALLETTFSFEKGHPRNHWCKTTTETLIQISKKLEGFKNRDVASVLYNLVSDMEHYILPSKKYRNVINHGDLWSNNIMFKYNEENCPKECVLVDFQMARYVPPVFDFLSVLYLTTTEQFHRRHFAYFVDLYFETFTNELKRHGINVDNVLSKCDFLESMNYYEPAALLEAAMFGTIVYLNGDFAKDMLSTSEKFDEFMLNDRSKLVSELFDTDEIFRERLSSVLIQLLNNIM